MKKIKSAIIIGSIGSILGPTLIWFFCQIFYGYISLEQFLQTLRPPKFWMLFVIVYVGIMIFYISNKVQKISQYIENPSIDLLSQAQNNLVKLSKFLMLSIILFCIIGPSVYILPVDYYTQNEYLLSDILAFAFIFLFTVPFFTFTLMNIDKLGQEIPMSKDKMFPSIKLKLAINMIATVFGSLLVIIILNISQPQPMSEKVDIHFVLLFKNLLIGCLCLIAGLINLFMLTRQLVTPVNKIIIMLGDISDGEGNLTKRLQTESRDDIGQLVMQFNTFVDTVHNMVSMVKDRTDTVNSNVIEVTKINQAVHSSSQEVIKAISEVAAGAASQAEDLSDINLTLNLFGNELDQASEQMQIIAIRAQEAAGSAEDDRNKLTELIDSVSFVRDSFGNVSDKVKELSQNIYQINTITDAINSIANKTNLLALNASIEAARAGEAGKGFAVVAEQIRELAEQSKQSSETIKTLVLNIGTDSEQVLETTAGVSDNLLRQSSVITTATASFEKLIEDVKNMKPEMEEALNRMVQVNVKKTEILKKVEEISSVSEETSAASQEINAITEHMDEQLGRAQYSFENLEKLTGDLKKQVDKFKTEQ